VDAAIGMTVLVTGGTGFIGGRLVEKLVLDRGESVRVLLRSYARATRVARFDVELVKADLADTARLADAMRGCDVVFHCAHDFVDADRNVEAAQAIARECLRAGVRRLVYLSSAAVYEPLPDGIVDESTPAQPVGWSYKDTKIRVEQELMRSAVEEGLSVAILQPTIVYGPFGSFWTEQPVSWLRSSRVVLPDGGEGLCNAVYVDDVVDAMLLSSTAELDGGERVLISAARPVTWREYFAAFERALGVRAVVCMPDAKLPASAEWSRGRRLRTALRHEPVATATRAAVKAATSALPPARQPAFARRLLGGSRPWRFVLPDDYLRALYGARATVSVEKARRVLGYEPAFDFERGMDLTALFIAWANL
jgi:nucleoside-diphosphate-sugar epimerase